MIYLKNEFTIRIKNQLFRMFKVVRSDRVSVMKMIQHLIITFQRKKYSPEQIVGRCKLEGKPYVSHEKIYQYVWADKRQKGKLYEHLRHRGRKYRRRGTAKDSRGRIPDIVRVYCTVNPYYISDF